MASGTGWPDDDRDSWKNPLPEDGDDDLQNDPMSVDGGPGVALEEDAFNNYSTVEAAPEKTGSIVREAVDAISATGSGVVGGAREALFVGLVDRTPGRAAQDKRESRARREASGEIPKDRDAFQAKYKRLLSPSEQPASRQRRKRQPASGSHLAWAVRETLDAPRYAWVESVKFGRELLDAPLYVLRSGWSFVQDIRDQTGEEIAVKVVGVFEGAASGVVSTMLVPAERRPTEVYMRQALPGEDVRVRAELEEAAREKAREAAAKNPPKPKTRIEITRDASGQETSRRTIEVVEVEVAESDPKVQVPRLTGFWPKDDVVAKDGSVTRKGLRTRLIENGNLRAPGLDYFMGDVESLADDVTADLTTDLESSLLEKVRIGAAMRSVSEHTGASTGMRDTIIALVQDRVRPGVREIFLRQLPGLKNAFEEPVEPVRGQKQARYKGLDEKIDRYVGDVVADALDAGIEAFEFEESGAKLSRDFEGVIGVAIARAVKELYPEIVRTEEDRVIKELSPGREQSLFDGTDPIRGASILPARHARWHMERLDRALNAKYFIKRGANLMDVLGIDWIVGTASPIISNTLGWIPGVSVVVSTIPDLLTATNSFGNFHIQGLRAGIRVRDHLKNLPIQAGDAVGTVLGWLPCISLLKPVWDAVWDSNTIAANAAFPEAVVRRIEEVRAGGVLDEDIRQSLIQVAKKEIPLVKAEMGSKAFKIFPKASSWWWVQKLFGVDPQYGYPDSVFADEEKTPDLSSMIAGE